MENHIDSKAAQGERAFDLGEELRLAREKMALTQKALADSIGCTTHAIRAIESGTGNVTMLVKAMEQLKFRLTGLTPSNSLHESLRATRVKKDWSVEKMAKRTGLSEQAIVDLERGGGKVADLLVALKVLAPRLKRRAEERSYWGQGDKEDRDSRFTCEKFMEHIYGAFGPIDLDPCAHRQSPVIAEKRIIKNEGGDGLADEWSGSVVYMNPPYSTQLDWMRRAHEQWSKGNVKTVVSLVPHKTDNHFYHDTLSREFDIFVLRGRVAFYNLEGKKNTTPFSLAVMALGTTRRQRAKFAKLASGFWMTRRRPAMRVVIARITRKFGMMVK
jgi:transcriptional regulator with XRE-family HTH domain